MDTITAYTATAKPLVSFIVPCYNLPPKLLAECIESILRLPLKAEERELILVDDGSDEPLASTLGSYSEQPIVLRQAHQGLSAARNLGIDAAQGEYIQFVDGDDWLIADTYSQCLELLRNDTPDVLLFHLTATPEKARSLRQAKKFTGTTFLLRQNMRASACGYLFKKNILDNLRFRMGRLHEDEEFTPRLLLKANTVISTDCEAYFYRRREGSITENGNNDWKKRRLDDVEKTIIDLKELSFSLYGKQKRALDRRIAQLTMDYLYGTMVLTHSACALELTSKRLQSMGLFPLPLKQYTWKYGLFAFVSRTKMGRNALLKILSKNS